MHVMTNGGALVMNHSPSEHDQLKYKLKLRLAERLELGRGKHQREAPSREAIQTILKQILTNGFEEHQRHELTPPEEEQLIAEILDDVVGAGPLEPLLTDETISEILINGPHEVFVERGGKLERSPLTFASTEQLLSIIERILDGAGVSVNETEPCMDASLPDGSRIHVIIPPVALNGPTMTIRKKLRPFTIDDWLRLGSLSPAAATFLEACVKARVNIVISGGTSTGKTTLVSVLSKYIQPEERVITIENVAELQLPNHKHWVRLSTRAPNSEGHGEITLRTLVKNALRMHPDRIILGEARGGEALDVIQAMLTGHDGAITVLHASSPHAAMERIQTLMLMSGLDLPVEICRRQVASAVELVIHLSHLPDGTRHVEKIVQVMGASNEGFALEELFVFQIRGTTEHGAIVGELQPTGAVPRFEEKFAHHNIQLSEDLFRHA